MLSPMLVAVLLTAAPVAPSVQVPPASSGAVAAERERLILALEDAQRRLRGGEALYVRLLAGAPASYPMADVSPRRAFLSLDFAKATRIEPIEGGSTLWKRYRLVVAPKGLGQPMWFIEVALGANGALERIEMLFEPPAPF